jgi:hypothetical protein
MERTIVAMKIEYFHASKYGNGAMVAEEFPDPFISPWSCQAANRE